jgi:ABC-type multidrug transport system fused ATPase/permease subunit
MFANIAALHSNISAIDMTLDKKYNYARLFYLALFQLVLREMEQSNDNDCSTLLGTVMKLCQLQLLSPLCTIMLTRFEDLNDKLVNDIQLAHARTLEAISSLNKVRSTTVVNEHQIISSNYECQIRMHVCKTRISKHLFEMTQITIGMLGHGIMHPVGPLALWWFLDGLALDTSELILNTNAQNKRAMRLRQKIDAQACEFHHNKSIIYECSDEDAYIKRMCRYIAMYFDIRKTCSPLYHIDTRQVEFTKRFAGRQACIALLMSSPDLNMRCSQLKDACMRLMSALVEYHAIQSTLDSQQLEWLSGISRLPTSTRSRIDISLIGNGTLFQIRPFSYNIADRRLFTVERMLTVPSKTWITILGKSGAGKTSFCNLCLKTIPYATGRVRFLGEYAAYEYDDIRRFVSHIHPQSGLFDKSIYDNISFGVVLKPRALNKRMKKYMAKCGIGHLVDRLGENASSLSTGEKQRVKLVRCILHDRPIWVFDEMTAHIDWESERDVIRVLKRLQIKKQKSVLHITHNRRLATFSECTMTIRDKKVEIVPTVVGMQSRRHTPALLDA